ncbi:NAD(P)H-binding protein [Pseudomonas sp. 681]|uniref:NAD(P)H-binding protein n=1 Tax=Pseudomonas fungipugnans TaxID=3024217 RepID=A0ABT6QYL9_9PSED|nr:NAD(P)H-binding protein [Pseudomonas sp. 681]MDI2595337.1 NAD(P)H-binding protein [Pseudomonas sp. 681]
MRALIFGATGMVGQGVLRESLLAADVEQVTVVGRTPVEATDRKLQSLVVPDLARLGGLEAQLQGFDACFFCLGVSSSGLDEAHYSRLTYDLTLAVAEVLARLNPQMTFVYVSGAGTDSTEKGKSMWARVKGRTENALLRLPFKAVYLFRPGVIQPLNGARSKTTAYRWTYWVMGPLLPVLRKLFPKYVLSTVSVGQAMLNVVRHGAASTVLETPDIQAAALRGQ